MSMTDAMLLRALNNSNDSIERPEEGDRENLG